jgi:L-ascorbate metabolism protein UlaG (beta-lactamase superfamily)
MYKPLRIIAQAILILFFLTGCKVVPPIPPTKLPTQKTSPVPPTTTPTAEATPAPPTPTPTPALAPVDPTALSITYICNDGFIISTAGKKILIDALFHDSKRICKADSDETAQNAMPPFDNADVVLVSHNHWDHFDPQIVGNYLLSNSKATLVVEKSAAEELGKNFDSFEQIQERVHSFELAEGQQAKTSLKDIDIEMISAPADVPNLGFLIHVGKFTFFHTGDSGFSPEVATDFQAYNLPEQRINFAFVPYWYMLDPVGKSILEKGIRAEKYIPMHAYGDDLEPLFGDILRDFPKTIFFTEEMQTWSP